MAPEPKKRGRFLLSGDGFSQAEPYRPFRRSPQEGEQASQAEQIPEAAQERAAQEEAYTTGGGSFDGRDRLTQLRAQARSEQIIDTSAEQIQQTESRSQTPPPSSTFAQWLLIGLTFLKDFMDVVLEVSSLGITLGILSAAFGALITVLIIVVRMFQGGSIRRFIGRWFQVYLLDTIIGFFLLFIPISTIGMYFITKLERKKQQSR